MINLQELNYKDEIEINKDINYSDEFIKNSDIIHLNNVKVIGNIKKDMEFNYLVNLNLTGNMIIIDANTGDEVPYDFNINIDETLESSTKTLDLMEFLWHYIVLEVPIKYTLCEDIHQKGDGYEVISEEEYENKEGNNPFKDFHLE